MNTKNGMKKLTALLLALLVLVPASLFAVPVVISWDWLQEDPDVTTFRYQMDAEDPEGWTVVDSSVTNYTVEGIDGSVEHVLYLQQSYDGKNWSESAKAPVEAISVEAEEPKVTPEAPKTVETPVVAPVEEPKAVVPVVAEKPEEAAAHVLAEAVVVAEPTVVETVIPVVAKNTVAAKPVVLNDFSFGLDLSIGAAMGLDLFQVPPVPGAGQAVDMKPSSPWMPEVSLGFKFNNIAGFGKNVGVGLRVDAGYMMLNSGWKNTLTNFFTGKFDQAFVNATHVATLSVMPKVDIAFNDRSRMAVEFGGDAYFTFPSVETVGSKSFGFLWGLAAGLQFEFDVNDWFSLGFNTRYHYVFDYRQYVDLKLVMGFHF